MGNIINPGGEVSTSLPIPQGVPMAAQFIGARAVYKKVDRDDNGDPLEGTAPFAVWMRYRIDDPEFPELTDAGTFVDTQVDLRRRPATKYLAHCGPIGITNPDEPWDEDDYKGAKVMVVLGTRKHWETGAEEPDVTQVFQRG